MARKQLGSRTSLNGSILSGWQRLFPTGRIRELADLPASFAHVQAALEYRPKGGGQDEWAIAFVQGGMLCTVTGGDTISAEQMAGKAWKTQEKRCGKGGSSSLASTSLAAEVIRKRGRWAEAETLEVQVMETRKTMMMMMIYLTPLYPQSVNASRGAYGVQGDYPGLYIYIQYLPDILQIWPSGYM